MLFALIAIMGLGLVDSFFIAFLGTNELAAIGFIVPITYIVTSSALGLGMAISSLTSKLIGAEQMESAARLITDAFYLTAAISFIIICLLTWQLDTVFALIGAEKQTLPAIDEYMHTWLFAIAFIMFTQVSASTFRAIGDTRSSAIIAISMTLTNLVLDPILIFGFGPIPAMGMQGAALATVIAALLACSMGLYKLGVVENLLIRALPKWHSFKNNFLQLSEIALPAVLANIIVPISSAALTAIVAQFGTSAVAGFGVGTRIEAFSLTIVYALSSTLPAFIGQNLGANKPARIDQAIRISFRFVIFLQIGVYLLLVVLADSISTLFSQDQQVKEVIKLFLWIVPISYGLVGVTILVNVSMNVLGKPNVALAINIARLFIFYLPLGYLGSRWFGIYGLFFGIVIANVATFLMATSLLKKVLNGLAKEPYTKTAAQN